MFVLEKSDVLVVDDTPGNVKALKRILNRKGHQVRGFTNGHLALLSVKAKAPDLILLDIRMPGMDGYDLCKKLKEDTNFSDIPVIFISGLTDVEDKIKAFEAGGVDYISKPFHAAEVILRVETHIKLYRSEKELEKRTKNSEDMLEHSEQKYHNLLESTPDPIVFYDKEGKIEYVNPSFTHVFGWTLEECFARKLDQFVPDENRPETQMMMDQLNAGQNFSGIESRRRTKEGNIIPVSISGAVYRAKDGQAMGSIINLRDTTEQKKLEAQFQQAQKMEAVGILAGGVAHDFNNILTVINGSATLALMHGEIADSVRKDIEAIQLAGERAAALIRQLLAFSRKQIIKPVILDFNKLFSGVEKMLQRLIGENIEILKIPGPKLWQVKIDPGQIEQVLMNLVVNARDAMPQGGKLTIETANKILDTHHFHSHGVDAQPGPYVMLAVRDTGNGMDKETQKHIFEPFYTTKESGKGTGLGLSSVYGIVKQNKGFVWASSETGQGATLEIYLPRASRDGVLEKKERVLVTAHGGSGTVLFVEDDETVRKLSRRILTKNGYTVLEAQNGEDALRVSKGYDGQIELMITDVIMPRMGGQEAAEQIRRFRPRMKIIYMSGYTDTAILDHDILAKEINFIQKPFSPENLTRLVQRVMDEK